MSSDTQSSRDWRADPNWRAVAYDPEHFDSPKKVPQKPTPQAELAQPPTWASLYEGNRIIVTWNRTFVTTEPRATVVGNDE